VSLPIVTTRMTDLSTDTFDRLAPTGARVTDVKIEW